MKNKIKRLSKMILFFGNDLKKDLHMNFDLDPDHSIKEQYVNNSL